VVASAGTRRHNLRMGLRRWVNGNHTGDPAQGTLRVT
jgi:hypothetical protein